MDVETILLSSSITIFSLGLIIISLISYLKFKSGKLLIISFIFIVFLIKGIILSLTLFYLEFKEFDFSLYFGFLDVIILTLLFISTLKR